MRYIVVIPARYQSSRLLGKPLVSLCGVPMIVRTYRQCLKAVAADEIYVATDDERIQSVCAKHEMRVVMTSSACLTGTDRLAEVAIQVDADVYISVQGDEPVFNPEDLTELIKSAEAYPGQVLNGYCAINDEAMIRCSSVPKVVMRVDGRLLYMSRAPIPTNKQLGFVRAWRQVCSYAFPKAVLSAFSARTRKSPLEGIEDIEILHLLELGFEVRMVEMTGDSIAVDTPEDVLRVERAIQERDLA